MIALPGRRNSVNAASGCGCLLDGPVLRPAKSALAGAPVGTALMEPGLGTAPGIKAGNLLNKLFGKKSEKTEE